MILLRSFLSGHIRIKRTLEYYDAGIGPRVPFGGGFGPTVSANFAVALGDYTTLSTTSTMPTGGSISRAGNAMLYDSTGKLTYAPNNLNTYSNDFSSWGVFSNSGASNPVVTPNYAAGPDNVAGSASRIVMDTGSTFGAISQIAPASVMGTTASAIVSIWLKSNTGATQTVGVFASNGNSTLASVTTEWQRFYYVASSSLASNSTFRLRATNGATSAVVDIQAAFSQCELVTYQTSPSGTYYLNYPTPNTASAYYGPRFDYDPVTLQPKGLLVEGTRTNLGQYSSVPGSWPTAVGLTVNSTNNAAPDGTNTASNITLTSAGYLYEPNYNPGNGTYTVTASAWLSGAAGTKIAFRVQDAATGTGGGNQIVTLTTTPTRYTFTVVVVVTGGSGITHGFDNRVGVVPGLPNIAATFTMWGYQFEVGAFATSFIPTVGNTTVTRAAETFSLTGYANRLVEAYYIDEQTGANFSGNSALSTGTVTISPPTFGWVTSLRAYTNAYAGSISSPSWLSFSRAGNATYYDSTGTLTWAPANLIQQSQTFNTVYWTKSSVTVSADAASAPDGTTTADNIISTVGTGEQRIYANPIPSTVGIRYTYSVYAKTGGANWLVMRDDARGFADTSFDLVNGIVGTVGSGRTASILSVGSGWYRCSVTVEVSASWVVGSISFCLADVDNGRATFVGNGVKSIYLWGAQLEPVTYQTAPSAYIPTTSAAVYGPRYDYDPSTVPATPRGLLIEESRANLLTYSDTLSSGWNTSVVTFSQASVTSPAGTGTVAQLGSDGTAAYKSTYLLGISSTASTNYTLSTYVKSNTLTRVSLALISGTNDTRYWYDLSAKTVGGAVSTFTSGYVNSGIQDVGNGWLRCWLTVTAQSTTIGAFIYPGKADVAAAGNVYIYGAQLEAGSFATSYIPTVAASVTRAADVAQLTGSALTTLQGANWTFVGEIGKIPQAFLTPVGVLGQNAFSKNAVRYNGTATDLNLWSDDGTTQAFTSPVAANTNNTRIGIAGTASLTSMVACAGTVQTLAKPMIWTNGFYLGLGPSGGGNPLNSTYRSLAIYNQRLPNTILTQKSTVGSPY